MLATMASPAAHRPALFPQRMQSRKRQQPNTKWWYLESCQRPNIAHVTVAPVGDKKNLYAQVG